MKIILASASPRRKEILEGLGVTFTVMSADTDESCELSEPAEYATELARRKGQAVWSELTDKEKAEAVIISADTIVACGSEILGKPKDRNDAYRMLKALSDREHEVVTGIGLTVKGVTFTDFCRTAVRVEDIPDGELWQYIDSGDPFDKAGGYGIQGEFSKWVNGIEGCYFNVVGLPANTLNRLYFKITGEYL